MIAAGEITEEQAAEIIDLYQKGQRFDLPLPEEESDVGIDVDEALIVAALFILLDSARIPQADLRTLTRAGRRRVGRALLERFESDVGSLARQLTSNRINIAEWQRQMSFTIREHLLSQVNAATGGRSAGWIQSRLDLYESLLEEQRAFLRRFADQISLRNMLEEPFSVGYLANRSNQYGGFALGEFDRAMEIDAVDNGEIVDGIVMEYIARDDAGTCSPCFEAQGFYLPGQGPYPGQICLGRHRCRCRRETRRDLNMWRRLTGQAA